MQTDAEIISAFRDFMARKGGDGPATFVPLQNHPLHRGVIDASYVRPAPTEFPKMVYNAAGQTKIVASREEQDALGRAWTETPVVKHSDWRAKAAEVYTKSGFRVYSHHVTFLRAAGLESIETISDAAAFLDKLDSAEQEQFFVEAEEAQTPIESEKEAKQVASKGKTKAA